MPGLQINMSRALSDMSHCTDPILFPQALFGSMLMVSPTHSPKSWHPGTSIPIQPRVFSILDTSWWNIFHCTIKELYIYILLHICAAS